MNHSRRLRVLCLHGQGASANIMEAQLRLTLFQPPSRSHLEKPLALSYLDGAFRMRDDEVEDSRVKFFFPNMPYYKWFEPYRNADGDLMCRGFDEALSYVLDFCKKEDPFDGVLGFSQGGVLAQVLLAMQRDGEIPTSFQFGIIMGIGKSVCAEFQRLFREKIPYPVLILFNADDKVVSDTYNLEAKTKELKAEELEADGNVAWLENDFNKAHHCFGQAIQLLDDKCRTTHFISQGQVLKARILCAQAQTYMSQGLAYSALRTAELAIRREPSTEGRFLRARAICVMEKRDEMYYETEEDHEAYLAKALTDLSIVIRVEPSNAPAKNELAFLEDLRRKIQSEAQVVDNTPLFETGLTRSQSQARIRSEHSPASLSRSASLRSGSGGARSKQSPASLSRSPSLRAGHGGAMSRSASGRQLPMNSRPASASRIGRATVNGASDTACQANGGHASRDYGAVAPGGVSASRSASRERAIATRCREVNMHNTGSMARSASLSRIRSLR